ncbi:thioesterase family protein [Nocardioides sp. AX2bis]|uniref:thioesterase family protein n=1 Tax=Nocardioides sp. AX2bis TaxID=2653157 RepID=UPI0012F1F235|nr:thioesterase family protein [Nocardioides sp. AX2bis]VXC00613.1 TesB-like acyl-CoA thioesterase 3 [Nocardioides sp. AX2bis]
MTYAFDEQTAVVPLGDGAWSADLHGGWTVGGGLNGGYLLAILGRTLGEALPGKPDPLSTSAYYVSAASPGPATVRVRVRREGRATATASVELVQDVEGREVVRVTALATCGDLGRAAGDVRTTAEPLVLPAPEDCVGATDVAPEGTRTPPRLMSRFDLRIPREQAGWAVGRPSGRGEISAWFRLEGGREPDVLALLSAVDALPPVTFCLGLPGWAPTLELTAHVRARPAPGWLRVRHATRNLAGGMFEEDCEVWDSADRLVAQSRQLALAPRTS